MDGRVGEFAPRSVPGQHQGASLLADHTSTSRVFIVLNAAGDQERALTRAAAMLRQNYRLAVTGVSPVYAVSAGGSLRLVAAVAVETDSYTPFKLVYDVLRFIERCLGANRAAASAPIALELALFGDRVIDRPATGIVLPHPDLATAAFALPLADLVPEVVHPVSGQTLGALAAALRADGAGSPRADVTLSE
jgi:7,8-dihydro-6-hydroxymethylpterin-pyrophosphokinase